MGLSDRFNDFKLATSTHVISIVVFPLLICLYRLTSLHAFNVKRVKFRAVVDTKLKDG